MHTSIAMIVIIGLLVIAVECDKDDHNVREEDDRDRDDRDESKDGDEESDHDVNDEGSNDDSDEESDLGNDKQSDNNAVHGTNHCELKRHRPPTTKSMLIGVLLSQRVSSTREKDSDHDVNCTTERQLGILYDLPASDRECRRLKLINWEEELRTCCEQSTSKKSVNDDRKVCGSRYNGTYGTFYYNKCALIYDRYQHPEECIIRRWGDFKDCERCGIKQTQPPPCVPRCAQASHIDVTEQANLEKECSDLRQHNWEAEIKFCSCTERKTRPQMVCGSRPNGTEGTWYYNECALTQARYLNPRECILERPGDHDDCKRCGIVQEEPPTCPFDDVKLDFNYDVPVRIIDHVDGCTSSCTRNSSVKFFCGDYVPRPPIFPLRFWPFPEQ